MFREEKPSSLHETRAQPRVSFSVRGQHALFPKHSHLGTFRNTSGVCVFRKRGEITSTSLTYQTLQLRTYCCTESHYYLWMPRYRVVQVAGAWHVYNSNINPILQTMKYLFVPVARNGNTSRSFHKQTSITPAENTHHIIHALRAPARVPEKLVGRNQHGHPKEAIQTRTDSESTQIHLSPESHFAQRQAMQLRR